MDANVRYLSIVEPEAEAERYLTVVFPDSFALRGQLAITQKVLAPGRDKPTWPTEWFSPTPQGLCEAALRAAHLGQDVYVHIATHDRTVAEEQSKQRAAANGKPWSGAFRGCDDSAVDLVTLAADIDIAEANKDNKKNYPPRQFALDTLAQLPLPPSMVVDSGNGLHAYWLLDKAHDAQAHKALPKQWLKYLKQNLVNPETGEAYALDVTGDLARILRVPGTTNSRGNKPVRIIELDQGRCYPIERIEALVADVEVAKKQGGRAARCTEPLPAWEVARIRDALSHLPADDYDDWLRIGMALQSTGDDQAFDLWCEWSEKSDNFDPDVQEEKWESFQEDRANGITLGTLFHEARERGWVDRHLSREAIAARIAGTDDFERLTGEILAMIHRANLSATAQEQLLTQIAIQADISVRAIRTDLEAIAHRAEAHDRDTLIEDLNKKHAVVHTGKTLILTEKYDETLGRPYFTLEQKQSLLDWYANKKMGRRNIAEVWFTHPSRRQYQGIVFAPGMDVPGNYNLFRGFPIEPQEGDCSQYWYLIKEVICNGNGEHYQFVRRWLAHLIQRPAELPGTALVLRGAQGTGKNTMVKYVGRLVGSHYLELNQMGQVVGRFNAHMQDALLVLANEAVWAGDKAAEGNLKAMITDENSPVEAKGRDIVNVRNYKRLIVSSNHDWAVARDADDRRFLVLDVSDKHKEDTEFFGGLDQQMMATGGLPALMFDLLHEDLSGFQPRALPKSQTGFDIKLRSAENIIRWLHEFLDEGWLWVKESVQSRLRQECGLFAECTLDAEGKATIGKSDLREIYIQWCKQQNERFRLDGTAFTKVLTNVIPGIRDRRPRTPEGQRLRSYVLPPLDQCRQGFEQYTKEGDYIWTPADPGSED